MTSVSTLEHIDERLVEWVKKNRRTATTVAAVLALIGGSV